ncbi:MAG: BirA family transcriptional regulator [Pseudonocardiales bacterium]|nr:BirA family transcriptional regulator [Pseudonocardiales bacterium]
MVDRLPLDIDRLRAALVPRWTHVDVVDETASTNADLLAASSDSSASAASAASAASVAPDRSVLVAEHQTSGRGRFDRVWNSPPRAGLTFSVLLRPDVPLLLWGWLPLLAGVALAEAVRDTAGVETSLKWPNDLLAGPDGRKAAGILVQTCGDAVVVGIGLNVSTTTDELPVETATSLALQRATTLDRTDLLAAILTRIDARVAQWTDCGGDAAACGLAAAYRDLCGTIGAAVRVTVADSKTVEGQAVDVDAGGRLVVRTPTGKQTIGAGDVEHLRLA